ncbi:MAG: C39 family peptidase [Candidatus Berkelbacteria bacterium]|nr:C39 family peptidase [Candidatus Berkelbacteria bacterium]MCR4307877.1 C39 family peptidase [Candidatus Berkelbacteria bacterium]
MRRGNAIIAIVIAVLALIFFTFAIVYYAVFGQLFNMDKPTGGGTGLGCIVPDQYFTDTSLANNPDGVIARLGGRYPAAKTNETYIREVLSRGQQEGINPVIPLAIWAGEQGFANPEKAFGYGYRDSGTISGVTAWSAQLDGVYRSIKLAVSSKTPYDSPEGTNNFTRLFYHYTTAMRNVYQKAGNSWNENTQYSDGSYPVKNRLAVIRLLLPQQIECASTTLAGTNNGNDGVPLFKQGDSKYAGQPYDGSTISRSGCCTVSAAMVLRFHQIDVDPISISAYSASHGYYTLGQGTDHAGLYKKLAGQYNLEFENLGTNWDKTISYLKQGKPILARGEGAEPYTSGGHCIVITGYDERTGMVRINNPARGDGPYPLSTMKALTTVMYFLGR